VRQFNSVVMNSSLFVGGSSCSSLLLLVLVVLLVVGVVVGVVADRDVDVVVEWCRVSMLWMTPLCIIRRFGINADVDAADDARVIQ